MSFPDSGTVVLMENYKYFSLLYELSCILMIPTSFTATDGLIIGIFCQ